MRGVLKNAEAICESCPLPDCTLPDDAELLECTIIKSSVPDKELKTVTLLGEQTARRKKLRETEPEIYHALTRHAQYRNRLKNSVKRPPQNDEQKMNRLKRERFNRLKFSSIYKSNDSARHLLERLYPAHYEICKQLRYLQKMSVKEFYWTKIHTTTLSTKELHKMDKRLLRLRYSEFAEKFPSISFPDYVQKNELKPSPINTHKVAAILRIHLPSHQSNYIELKIEGRKKAKELNLKKILSELGLSTKDLMPLKDSTMRMISGYLEQFHIPNVEEYINQIGLRNFVNKQIESTKSKIMGGAGEDFGIMHGAKGVASPQKLKQGRAV